MGIFGTRGEEITEEVRTTKREASLTLCKIKLR
jgi:hypothetical protein